MTVRDELKPRPAEEPIPHHWTLDEYHRAIDAGVFGDRRVELLHGEVVDTPPMNEPHIGAGHYPGRAVLRAARLAAHVQPHAHHPAQ